MKITDSLGISICSCKTSINDNTNIVLLGINNQRLFVPLHNIDYNTWGKPQMSFLSSEEDNGMFSKEISFLFYDKEQKKVFGKFIELSIDINNCSISTSNEKTYTDLLIGITRELNLAIWLYSPNKSKLIYWQGKGFDIMVQYKYRYLITFSTWNEESESWENTQSSVEKSTHFFLCESLYDGTFNKKNDPTLLNYHEAGIPHKLSIEWQWRKTSYSINIFFNNEIIEIFKKFYGIHCDTISDFRIIVDPMSKKYALSLYRYGMKEPMIIPETTYQIIVFKSGFEYFRSTNYSQLDGAWIW